MANVYKYKTAAAFEKAARRYFKSAEENKKPFTVTGLCIELGITRQTLLNYENNEEIDGLSEAVKMAKLLIENFLEERLFEHNVTGVIFNLKNNFNWKDKTETELTGKDGERLIQPILNVTTA